MQHCIDVGRLAFRDAQKRLNKINSIARSVMADGGSISYIVELLEDPEDAIYNLKPELEEVGRTVQKFGKECEAIRSKFEYWQLVSMNLSQSALDVTGTSYLL